MLHMAQRLIQAARRRLQDEKLRAALPLMIGCRAATTAYRAVPWQCPHLSQAGIGIQSEVSVPTLVQQGR